jgi:hypothetical protein
MTQLETDKATPHLGRSLSQSHSNTLDIAVTNGTNGMAGQKLFLADSRPEKASSTAIYNSRVASHKMVLFRLCYAACLPFLPHTLQCS